MQEKIEIPGTDETCADCGHPFAGIRHRRLVDNKLVHPPGACPSARRVQTVTPPTSGRGLSAGILGFSPVAAPGPYDSPRATA